MPAAARQNDTVTATDTHIDLVPTGSGFTPTPLPYPFSGPLSLNLSGDVLVNGLPIAVVGSVAVNNPPHVPAPGPFQRPPHNTGTVDSGSSTVLVNQRPAARLGDPVKTCNDPVDQPVGTIVTGSADVLIGG